MLNTPSNTDVLIAPGPRKKKFWKNYTMLSQQELGFNFWGFSFLSRKQGRVLHRFSRIIHEKNFSTKCTYEHDNWPRHTDKSVVLLQHWSTLREFQSSLTDFTMPKSSLCCTGLRQYKLKWLLCCYLELGSAALEFFLKPREDHWLFLRILYEVSKTLIGGCWKRRSWFWTRNPTSFIVRPYTDMRLSESENWISNEWKRAELICVLNWNLIIDLTFELHFCWTPRQRKTERKMSTMP